MRLFAPSRFLPGVLAPIALALALAGCGSMDYPAQAAGGGLSISASALSVATNGEIALHASPASGQAAPVQWKIVSGTNSPALGQGHIEPTGVYRAPGSLSADSMAVRIEARLQSNPATWGALTLIVHPGFVQPLLPQNVALTPGASAEVTAQIAEVDAGNVSWSLGASQAGGQPANGTLGTLSNSACRRASTTCNRPTSGCESSAPWSTGSWVGPWISVRAAAAGQSGGRCGCTWGRRAAERRPRRDPLWRSDWPGHWSARPWRRA